MMSARRTRSTPRPSVNALPGARAVVSSVAVLEVGQASEKPGYEAIVSGLAVVLSGANSCAR